MKLKENFPPIGSEMLGGTSDGLVYRTAFAGTNMTDTLAMVCEFLQEVGYGDLPIPKNTEEMLAFLQPEEGRHPHLFEEPDYTHFPLRLILPKRDRRRKKLIVEIYNESAPDCLLRFHRRQCPDREARIRQAIEEEHTEKYWEYMPADAI